jgi:hypothetical protein
MGVTVHSSGSLRLACAGVLEHALRLLIRIWVGKFESGALDDYVQAADLMQEYEVTSAALERMVGRQSLEIEQLKGALT